MAEIYIRGVDGFGPQALDSKLLAEVLKKRRFKLTKASHARVLSILSEHSCDRDDGPFLPEYILWVAKEVRREIRRMRKIQTRTRVEVDPTKELFKNILNEAIKGFHINKGKIIISEIAWAKFCGLDPRNYNKVVFQQIIAEAVAARRRVNEERGAKIRAAIGSARNQIDICC